MDGYDKPLVLNAALTISDDGIHVDFDGTSPASGYGINVVLNYCLAYTAFGVKCLVAPDVPNNAGSLAPITVSAPEGCVLNAKRPWPVAARHTVGQMLPDVVSGCLHQAIAGGVPAEGASSLWNPQIFGGGSLVDEVEEGTDANDAAACSRPSSSIAAAPARGRARTGLAPRPFRPACAPSRSKRPKASRRWCSIAANSAKVRAARENSAAGSARSSRSAAPAPTPVALLCNFERVKNPARGRDGGGAGAAGAVALRSGRPIRPKGRQTVPPRDAIRLELPGGGGFGDPRTRDPQSVRDDVLDGLITADEARRDYGVIIDARANRSWRDRAHQIIVSSVYRKLSIMAVSQ